MTFLIVGCGMTGAVIARQLAECGERVMIWDRRDHIGGNMFDETDGHGFLVQKYGPHTFHTNKKELYDYICRFERWQEFRLTCGAVWDGEFTPTLLQRLIRFTRQRERRRSRKNSRLPLQEEKPQP